jgi:hypothetical protein
MALVVKRKHKTSFGSQAISNMFISSAVFTKAVHNKYNGLRLDQSMCILNFNKEEMMKCGRCAGVG